MTADLWNAPVRPLLLSLTFINPAIIPKMDVGNNKLITPMSFYRHCDKVLMISKLVFLRTNDLMVSLEIFKMTVAVIRNSYQKWRAAVKTGELNKKSVFIFLCYFLLWKAGFWYSPRIGGWNESRHSDFQHGHPNLPKSPATAHSHDIPPTSTKNVIWLKQEESLFLTFNDRFSVGGHKNADLKPEYSIISSCYILCTMTDFGKLCTLGKILFIDENLRLENHRLYQ